MKPMLTTLVLGMSLGFGLPALAEGQHGGHSHDAASDHAGMDTKLSDAEVKKIDKSQGKITLKHGPIDNLGMPGMTMVFKVQDASMLDQVKAGDNVRFMADKMNGALVVTKLQMAK